MEYEEIIKRIQPEFDKIISSFENEISKIRTGRASPSLIEDIEADCFGQKFALKQLAAISSPSPRQLLIQPWDKSYIEGIVKALERSNIGADPIADKDLIRINLPPMSEEYRKNLLRLLSEKQEEARRNMRHYREEAWRDIQDGFREGKIREDDKFRGKDELQDLIKEYNEKIEQLGENKKKELME